MSYHKKAGSKKSVFTTCRDLNYGDEARLERVLTRLRYGAEIGCTGRGRIPTFQANDATATEFGSQVADAGKVQKLIRELPQMNDDPLAVLQEALDCWENKDARNEFAFKPIKSLDLLKIVGKMGNTSSSANDRLDALMIKNGIQYLHEPLLHVINLSISTNTFASRWKIGKLLPLHKGKGLDHRDPASFRPISLLPIIGKLTERALQPQIILHMTLSKQLNLNHHSYRAEHSTTTAMLQLSDLIFEGCNLNEITTAVTLDQSAAFDMLKHNTLLKKLSMYKFQRVHDRLSDRSNYVLFLSLAPVPKLKNCRIGTKICVVVDIDHVIMIVVTKRQKRQKDKNTKGQKDKKDKNTKGQKDKKERQKKYKQNTNKKKKKKKTNKIKRQKRQQQKKTKKTKRLKRLKRLKRQKRQKKTKKGHRTQRTQKRQKRQKKTHKKIAVF